MPTKARRLISQALEERHAAITETCQDLVAACHDMNQWVEQLTPQLTAELKWQKKTTTTNAPNSSCYSSGNLRGVLNVINQRSDGLEARNAANHQALASQVAATIGDLSATTMAKNDRIARHLEHQVATVQAARGDSNRRQIEGFATSFADLANQILGLGAAK